MTLRKFNAGETVKYIGRKEPYVIMTGPDSDGDYTIRNKRTNQLSFAFHSRLSAIPSPPKAPEVPKREFNVGDKVIVACLDKEVPYVIVFGPDSDGDYTVRNTRTKCAHYVSRSRLSLWEEPKAPEPSINNTRAPIGSPPAPVESNHPRTKQAVEMSTTQTTQSNQEGKSIMSNINRTLVTVALLDNDSGLKVEHSLVHDFGSHVLEGSQEDLKMEIVMNNDMSNIVAVHNAKRAKETDLDILKRTGNKVKLQERKLSELTWVISAK